jgi:hypothetical protein
VDPSGPLGRWGAMPRYFFHLRNDLSVNDQEGLELPNLETARERGIQYALDMSAASIREHRKLNLHHRIEVADESGEIAFNVEFGDVVTIETAPPVGV